MSFSVTRLDISQIEGSWYFQEHIELIPDQQLYSLLYSPIEDSELVFIDKIIQYPEVEYLIVDNSIRFYEPITSVANLYITYSTKDELNHYSIFSDEMGNVLFINNITDEPIIFY